MIPWSWNPRQFICQVSSRLIGMSRRTWGTDIHTYMRYNHYSEEILHHCSYNYYCWFACKLQTLVVIWFYRFLVWFLLPRGLFFFWHVNLSSVLCSDDLTLKLQAAMPAGFRVIRSLNKLLTEFRRMSFTLTHRVIQQSSNHTKSGSGIKTMISKDCLLALWHPLLPHRL